MIIDNRLSSPWSRENMKLITALALLCLVSVGLSFDCIVWSTLPYDTDLSNDTGTPRGYDRTTIPNPEIAEDDDYPCVLVTAVSSIQYIEVNIETTQIGGTSRICVNINDGDESSCGNGRTSFCDKVPDVNMEVTFFCDSSCDISETSIYYRVTLNDRTDIDDENWCQSRTQDYPSGLLAVLPPTDVTSPTTFRESALNLQSFPLSILITLAAILLAVPHILRV